MLKLSPHGTKIDLRFTFKKLKLGIKFPCEILLVISGNYENKDLEPIQFDPINMEALIDKSTEITHVFKPIATDPVKIDVIIRSNGKKKNAGIIHFDVLSSINSNNFATDLFLEKCPDKHAFLRFEFSHKNIRDNPVEVKDPHKKMNTNNTSEISFYSAFANNDFKPIGNTRPHFNTSMAGLNMHRGESPNVRMDFGNRRLENRNNYSMNHIPLKGLRANDPIKLQIPLEIAKQNKGNYSLRDSDIDLKATMNKIAKTGTHTSDKNAKNNDDKKLHNMRVSIANDLRDINSIQRVENSPIEIHKSELSIGNNENSNAKSTQNTTQNLDSNFKSGIAKKQNLSAKTNPLTQVEVCQKTNGGSKQNESVQNDRSIKNTENFVLVYKQEDNHELILLNAKISELNGEIVQRNVEITGLTNEILKVKSDFEASEKEKNKVQKELDEERTSFANRLSQMSDENEKLKNKLIEAHTRKIEESKMHELEKQTKELLRQNSQLQDENESKDLMLSNLKQRFTDLEIQNGKLQSENTNLSKDCEERIKTLKNSFAESIRDKNKEVANSQNEFECAKRECETLRNQIDGLTAHNSNLSNENEVLKKNFAEENKKNSVNVISENQKLQIEEQKNQISNFQFEITDKKNKIKILKEENKKLEEEKHAETSEKDRTISRQQEKLAKLEKDKFDASSSLEKCEQKLLNQTSELEDLKQKTTPKSLKNMLEIGNVLKFERKQTGLPHSNREKEQTQINEQKICDLQNEIKKLNLLRKEEETKWKVNCESLSKESEKLNLAYQKLEKNYENAQKCLTGKSEKEERVDSTVKSLTQEIEHLKTELQKHEKSISVILKAGNNFKFPNCFTPDTSQRSF